MSTDDLNLPPDFEAMLSCDFKQCKHNLDNICNADLDAECPKNNGQSVYEKAELLK